MKGNEIIEYIVRGDMPDLEEVREKCHKQTVNETDKKWSRTRNLKPILRRPLLAGIVVILCLSLALPAFAVNIPITYELLYSISPSVAQFFKPIQKSYENDGILMDVIATNIYDNTAELYISVQDLTGTRVDATTDLFDSYSINRPFDSSATCQLVSFDETTNTAFFLISITEFGNQKISGNKITFTVRNFLSGKKIYEGIPITIDMSNILNNPKTMPMPTENGGGFGGEYGLIEKNPFVLIPSSPISFGVDGINITGMGYVDGLLHIQTTTGDYLTSDNHGYFYFKDKDGSDTQCLYNISFNEYENEGRVRYNEFVFDIPQSQIDEYEIYGHFVAGGILTEGYWQITFPLTAS